MKGKKNRQREVQILIIICIHKVCATTVLKNLILHNVASIHLKQATIIIVHRYFIHIYQPTIDSGSKLQHEVECPEHHVRFNQLIAVELSEELQATEPTLVHLGDVQLKAEANILQYTINHLNNSIFLKGKNIGSFHISCDYHMTSMKISLMCTYSCTVSYLQAMKSVLINEGILTSGAVCTLVYIVPLLWNVLKNNFLFF